MTVAPPAQAPAGVPFEVRAEVDASGGEARLHVDRRPASEPGCGPTPMGDHPSASVAHLTPSPLAVAGTSTVTLPDVVDGLGTYRYCAWLMADLLTPRAPVAEAAVRVRPLAVSVRIRRVWQTRVDPASTALPRLVVDVVGRAEGPTSVEAFVLKPRSACPRVLGRPGSRPLRLLAPGNGFVEAGAFRLRFRPDEPLPMGRWRICAAIRDVRAATRIGAQATATYRLRLPR